MSYPSTIITSDLEGYINIQFGNVGATTLGDWNDVTNAVGVMGVQNFHVSLGMTVGDDVFFVTYNGVS